MNDLPLVSILMTAYNREKYIADAIESVLISNYENWELIIVDDQSIDHTFIIAKKYASKDERIKVYLNEKNLGDYPNRNQAAKYAKGTYIKYLDADDTIYKYSLNYFIEAMTLFPDAALGISFNTIDDRRPYPQKSSPLQTYHSEYLGKSILGCGPSAAIIRKDVFDLVGGFSGRQYIGDHELWLRIAADFAVVKLQPSLIWYRQHPDQQVVEEQKNINIMDDRFKLSLNALMISSHFFKKNEFAIAQVNVKKNYARIILRKIIIERMFIKGFHLWRMSGLSIVQLLSGLKKTKFNQ